METKQIKNKEDIDEEIEAKALQEIDEMEEEDFED
jgi:hypothetical protein